MTNRIPDGERSDRILSGKLRLLFRGTTAIATNVAIGSVVVVLLWHSFPHGLLVAWLGATLAVCAARILMQNWFYRSVGDGHCNPCWAMRFTLGTMVSGMIWGLLCLGLPLWGDHFDFVLMAVVCAGMSAGALATISAHLPAYFAYSSGFGVPFAIVCLVSDDRHGVGIGVMAVVYLAAISVTALRSSAFVNRTVELKVDNEILQESLKQTRIERDVARTEKWSTLAQLSHELRTPLNAILGFSEAMHQEFFGPIGNGRYKDYAGHVLESGHHLLHLIEQLLQLSQGESGDLTLDESDVDVAALIEGLTRLMAAQAQKAGLTVSQQVPPDLPLVRADKTKLRQMLFNLVDNAIKFTPPGGTVLVEAQTTDDGGLALVVRDSGIGMNPESIPVALRPFGRLATPLEHSTSGAGFGLPICRRLAELHAAGFSVVSEPQKGTTCTISLPRARVMQRCAAAAA